VLVRTPLLLLLNDQLLLYYCLAMINTALGLGVHAFFFVPLLLDIVVQSRLLQKVHLVHRVYFGFRVYFVFLVYIVVQSRLLQKVHLVHRVYFGFRVYFVFLVYIVVQSRLLQIVRPSPRPRPNLSPMP